MTLPDPKLFEREMRDALDEIEAAMRREGVAFTAEAVADRCRRAGLPAHSVEALSAIAGQIIAERAGGEGGSS